MRNSLNYFSNNYDLFLQRLDEMKVNMSGNNETKKANGEAPIIGTWRLLLPQWFTLPSTREAHSSYVYIWKASKKCIYLTLHVVVGRYDIEEILDDAKIEIDAKRICRQRNPTSCHTVGKHRTDGILFVPHTSMVTAGIACQGNDSEPRLEGCYLQTEWNGVLLLII